MGPLGQAYMHALQHSPFTYADLHEHAVMAEEVIVHDVVGHDIQEVRVRWPEFNTRLDYTRSALTFGSRDHHG